MTTESIEIPGRQIGLPMVIHVSRVRSHTARRISWHSHEGFELLFLLEGATAYEFADRQVLQLAGGHFLVIPPGVVHRGQHNVRSPCTICGLALSAAAAGAWKHTTFTPADVQRIRSALESSSRTVHPFNPSLRWLVRRLMDALAGFPASAESPTTAATLRTLICGVLLESMVQMLSPPRAPQASVAAAIDFFRQHLDEPIHIPDLVRHLGFSRARTFELFKSQTGLTPNDYLQRLRIEKARELLRATRRSITAIALETGFSSGQYFCTVFRRYTGLSPAAYRQANRAGKPARRTPAP